MATSRHRHSSHRAKQATVSRARLDQTRIVQAMAVQKEVARVLGDTSPVSAIPDTEIARSFWGRTLKEQLSDVVIRSAEITTRAIDMLRHGEVLHLAIDPTTDVLAACVYDHKDEDMYVVQVSLGTVRAGTIDIIQAAMMECGVSYASVMQGTHLPPRLQHVFTDPTTGFLPEADDLSCNCDCDCTGKSVCCVHTAAVLYAIAHLQDTAPELLFLLRGLDAHAFRLRDRSWQHGETASGAASGKNAGKTHENHAGRACAPSAQGTPSSVSPAAGPSASDQSAPVPSPPAAGQRKPAAIIPFDPGRSVRTGIAAQAGTSGQAAVTAFAETDALLNAQLEELNAPGIQAVGPASRSFLSPEESMDNLEHQARQLIRDLRSGKKKKENLPEVVTEFMLDISGAPDDPKLRKDFLQTCRNIQGFSWDAQHKRLMAHIRSLLSSDFDDSDFDDEIWDALKDWDDEDWDDEDWDDEDWDDEDWDEDDEDWDEDDEDWDEDDEDWDEDDEDWDEDDEDWDEDDEDEDDDEEYPSWYTEENIRDLKIVKTFLEGGQITELPSSPVLRHFLADRMREQAATRLRTAPSAAAGRTQAARPAAKAAASKAAAPKAPRAPGTASKAPRGPKTVIAPEAVQAASAVARKMAQDRAAAKTAARTAGKTAGKPGTTNRTARGASAPGTLPVDPDCPTGEGLCRLHTLYQQVTGGSTTDMANSLDVTYASLRRWMNIKGPIGMRASSLTAILELQDELLTRARMSRPGTRKF